MIVGRIAGLTHQSTGIPTVQCELVVEQPYKTLILDGELANNPPLNALKVTHLLSFFFVFILTAGV